MARGPIRTAAFMTALRRHELLLQSRHLEMPDGVRIAVDVLLPPPASNGKGEGMPTILIQCRYMRAVYLRLVLSASLPALGRILTWREQSRRCLRMSMSGQTWPETSQCTSHIHFRRMSACCLPLIPGDTDAFQNQAQLSMQMHACLMPAYVRKRSVQKKT